MPLRVVVRLMVVVAGVELGLSPAVCAARVEPIVALRAE